MTRYKTSEQKNDPNIFKKVNQKSQKDTFNILGPFECMIVIG